MTTHLKVIGCLTYTDKEKMNLIFESYKDCWDFFKFDEDPNTEFALKVSFFKENVRVLTIYSLE